MPAAANARSRALPNVGREKPARRRRSTKSPWALLCGCLIVTLIGLVWVHVWLRLQVVHMGYVLSTTSKLHGRLEQENRELKIELATLTSPERLEALARRRLGLKQPEKGQVIVLP
jgi:cell division protein FtsL